MLPLRDENPSHSFPFVTIVLIVANAAIFYYQMSLGKRLGEFVIQFAMIPAEITGFHNLPFSTTIPPLASLFTSMFLHGGIGHLLGNMWFLWIFGDNIEDFLGHFGFLLFYLLTGIAADLAHVAMNPDSAIPTLGASGAISGVLGAYIVLHPRIRIRTLVILGFFWRVVRIPAIFFLGIWFLMQFMGGLGDPRGRVAYGAHIGGFVAGVLFILLFTRRSAQPPEHRFEANRSARWHH